MNRNATGMGYNNWPSFRPYYPDPGSAVDFPPQQSGKPSEEFIDCMPATAVGNRGTWYKLAQFTQPAQRAMIGDARQFYLEAKRIAPGGIPGQRLNFITQDYSTFGGQTTYDFYRHGSYPPVENSNKSNGHYRATGGKIGYNILYADNQVEAPTDRETAYRAVRMRFPG